MIAFLWPEDGDGDGASTSHSLGDKPHQPAMSSADMPVSSAASTNTYNDSDWSQGKRNWKDSNKKWDQGQDTWNSDKQWHAGGNQWSQEGWQAWHGM